jgi:Outer membrane protein beta-barrel domain
MKKSILSVLLVATCLSYVFSQSIGGGLRLGMNIANQSTSVGNLPPGVNATVTPTSAKIGFQIGGYLKIMTSEKFGIQPEIVYSQMGFSAPSGQTGKANFNYLSIPVLLRYNLTENVNIHAGPQLGFVLAASETDGTNTVDIKNEINGLDFGGGFGLGVDFGKFNAGARYYLGLSNLIKNVPTGIDVAQKNNAIQIFVGYQLFGK